MGLTLKTTHDAVDVIAYRLRHLHYLRQVVLRATLTEFVSLCVFVHGWCCFGLSTFSVWPWTDAYNPGEPGGGRRAAALAADSAPLHRLPVRRSNASCGLLQTNLYTPRI